jgi:hypothetical protein
MHSLLTPDAFAIVFEPFVGRRVGYIRPIGNVGDRLIELATVQLFAIYGIDWQLVDPQAPLPERLDVLAFGGGGNMGTLYRNNYELRTWALACGLPLVILPQSFTTPEDRGFARVYIRERGSLALHPGGILAPDLALGLDWPAQPRPDRDLGLFLRRDGERTGWWKPRRQLDPVKWVDDPAAYLALAARHRRIVTDRLHMAIAGLHAGRDVTLLANAYHKNRSLHETWLAALGCRFAATPRAALRTAA